MRRMAFLCALLLLVPSLASASLTFTASIASSPSGPDAAPGAEEFFVANYGVSGALVDCFRVQHVSGAAFYAPDVIISLPAGWSQIWGYPHDAAAEGPGMDPLNWQMQHAGPLADFALNFAAYYQGGYVGAIHTSYVVGQGFTNTGIQWDPGKDPMPTPEPATWFSLIAGMGVLGWMRFRG